MWLNKFNTLSSFQLVLLIFITSIITLIPSLFSGLMGDDLLHYLLFNKPDTLPLRADYSFFNLFSFVDDDKGNRLKLMQISLLPWWVSTDFTWNFWRPLAELTHGLDYVFFKRNFIFMHLHSLFWFALLLFLMLKMYRVLFQEKALSLLAFGVFAFSLSHAVTVAWLSNRHAIIASIFILGAFLFHHKAEQKRSLLFYSLALMMTLLAFLASELGVSTGVWFVCYTFFLNPKQGIHKWIRLLPYAVIFFIWAYYYRQGNFGINGYSTFYLDPAKYPWQFLVNYSENLPAIIAAQFWVIPADIFSAIQYSWVTPIIGGLTAALLFLPLRHNTDKRLLGFLLTSFLLLAIPIATSPAQDRNLLQVSMAFSGLLALVLYQCFQLMKDIKYLRLLFFTILFLHFVVSPLLTLPMSYAPKLLAHAGERRAKTLSIAQGDQVIIFKGDMMETTYLYPRRVELAYSLPSKLWNIGGHHSQLKVSRINDNTLQVHALNDFFTESDLMARDIKTDPFNQSVKTLNGIIIRVDAVSKKGLPESMTLIHEAGVKLFVWQKMGYKQFKLKKGESIAL